MANKREPLSKKIRFEVFKRDSFKCQYCGKSAPDVILEVDHISPVAKGGDNDIVNLITACKDCNAGKRDRELSDDAVVAKRKAQLDELQTRREQIEMMVQWSREIESIEQQTLDTAVDFLEERIEPYSASENGEKLLKRVLKKYGLAETLEAIKISTSQYVKTDDSGVPTYESVEKSFDYIERIVRSRKKIEENPWLGDLYYIRGILRNRLHYLNEWKSLDYLKKAYLVGTEIDELKAIALESANWTEWQNSMIRLLEVACPKAE